MMFLKIILETINVISSFLKENKYVDMRIIFILILLDDINEY